MSKKKLYALVILFLALNVYLLVKVFSTTLEKPVENGSEKKHPYDSKESYISFLRGRIQLQAKYSKVSIKPGAILMDTLGRDISIEKAIIGKENLVFFFTKNHCYSCIDATIPYLEKLADSVGYDKILLLGALNEKRDILSFKAKYKSRLRIYSVENDDIISTAKDLSYPFLFLLDNKNETNSLFFAEKDLPEVTEDFMKEMQFKFKDQSSPKLNR